MSRRRRGPTPAPLPPQPMPTPIGEPHGAAPFAPLWELFVASRTALSTNAPALERFKAWWGGPLAADLVQWLGASRDGIRPLTSVPESEDSFAWLLQSRELLDYHIYFGGLLPITGPDVQDTTFYAVIEPPRPTTRVVRWDLGFDFGGPVALDLPSFWQISDVFASEFPPDDDDELRACAEALPGVSGRFVYTFPWTRWLDAIDDRLGDDAPSFGTFDPRRQQLPDAERHLMRAQPIIDALFDKRPFAGPKVDHAQLDAELAELADFPPRALYWMWLAALNGDSAALARVADALASSASKIVRDGLVHARAHGG